jgi:hypothetical protein
MDHYPRFFLALFPPWLTFFTTNRLVASVICLTP